MILTISRIISPAVNATDSCNDISRNQNDISDEYWQNLCDQLNSWYHSGRDQEAKCERRDSRYRPRASRPGGSTPACRGRSSPRRKPKASQACKLGNWRNMNIKTWKTIISWGICTRRACKLNKARFRLYRSQNLQEHMRWKALAEIYTMHSFAQLCNLNFLSQFYDFFCKI